MNIILIGFMGSGKSSVGKHLSALLQLPLIEMDDLVLQKTGCRSAQEVFSKGGELLWRATEIAVAQDLESKTGRVISTGGGVVLNKIIIDYLKKPGSKVIYLKTSFEQLVKRVEGDPGRPLFQNLSEAQQHYDFRLPLYHHYADEVIDTDTESPLDIASKIHEKLTSAHGF